MKPQCQPSPAGKGKPEGFPPRQGHRPSAAISAGFLPSLPARRQLRLLWKLAHPPTGGCQLRFPAELRSRRQWGHPGVKMGFPGDIQPPANHTVCLEILGAPRAEGQGSPPNLSAAPNTDSLLGTGRTQGRSAHPAKAQRPPYGCIRACSLQTAPTVSLLKLVCPQAEARARSHHRSVGSKAGVHRVA